jgi:hypothetical protein
MTNFEAIVKNNPGYVKEALAANIPLDDLKCATTGELKHDDFYNNVGDKREMDFLNAEYVAPILDDVERKYLSDVIRPFKNRVRTIQKSRCSGQYFIEINIVQNYDRFCLPYFSAESDMYKGMELNKVYTLKELGL